MRKYSSNITLAQTSRGVWGLDTVKGCKHGMNDNKKGCYGVCYANLIANRYGYDFSDSTIRRFESKSHLKEIINKIADMKSDFIRIGIMGDPSECWGHTIDICDKIKDAGKKIVIIAKHWESIPEYLYKKVESLGLIINTSVSALDSDRQIKHRLSEYNKLKEICTSVLRVVSCDFNINNIMGIVYEGIQRSLFLNDNIIDTILRLPISHNLIKNNVVNFSKARFMSKNIIASVNDKNTHLGNCESCNEKCGVCYERK